MYTKPIAVVMPVIKRSPGQAAVISMAIAAVSAQVSVSPTFTMVDEGSVGQDQRAHRAG